MSRLQHDAKYAEPHINIFWGRGTADAIAINICKDWQDGNASGSNWSLHCSLCNSSSSGTCANRPTLVTLSRVKRINYRIQQICSACTAECIISALCLQADTLSSLGLKPECPSLIERNFSLYILQGVIYGIHMAQRSASKHLAGKMKRSEKSIYFRNHSSNLNAYGIPSTRRIETLPGWSQPEWQTQRLLWAWGQQPWCWPGRFKINSVWLWDWKIMKQV